MFNTIISHKFQVISAIALGRMPKCGVEHLGPPKPSRDPVAVLVPSMPRFSHGSVVPPDAPSCYHIQLAVSRTT